MGKNKQSKFELAFFEDLLQGALHPSKIENTLKVLSPEELEAQVKDAADGVCKALRAATCSMVKESKLERYIQTHQREAIRMLDQVYAMVKEEAAVEFGPLRLCAACMDAYKLVKAALRTVLDYTERYLGKYFDMEQLVPDSFRITSARQLHADKLVLTARLKAKAIDPSLQLVLLDFVSSHCERTSCSYQEQQYAKLLVENLLNVLKSDKKKDWNRKVVVVLIYLNFNKGAFFAWCRKFIAAEVDEFKLSQQQYTRFNWFLKEIKSLGRKPDVGYRSGRPAIHKLLVGYIAAELVYLAEWNREHPDKPAKAFKERAEQFDFKLPLSLTVPQLALIAQLFIDVGVFAVEKGQVMTVMRFLAEHVSTAGTADISAGNLTKHRKLADPKVCEAIERILDEMMVVLKDRYMG